MLTEHHSIGSKQNDQTEPKVQSTVLLWHHQQQFLHSYISSKGRAEDKLSDRAAKSAKLRLMRVEMLLDVKDLRGFKNLAGLSHLKALQRAAGRLLFWK